MTVEEPLLLWHCAAGMIHRQVALTAFLREAQKAGRPLHYLVTDPAATIIIAIARELGLAVHGTAAADFAVAAVPTAVWVTTHQEGESFLCQQLQSLRSPPSVILCLSDFFCRHRQLVPPSHAMYVTGAPLPQSPL